MTDSRVDSLTHSWTDSMTLSQTYSRVDLHTDSPPLSRIDSMTESPTHSQTDSHVDSCIDSRTDSPTHSWTDSRADSAMIDMCSMTPIHTAERFAPGFRFFMMAGVFDIDLESEDVSDAEVRNPRDCRRSKSLPVQVAPLTRVLYTSFHVVHSVNTFTVYGNIPQCRLSQTNAVRNEGSGTCF